MQPSFNDLKDGSINPESVLFPEVNIADIPLESLKIEVMDSGFYSFNEYAILKSNKPEFILVGARPSMGKSAMMFQIAEQVANTNKNVLVFSLEMDKEQILTRLLSKRTGIPISHIQFGKADPEVLKKEKEKLLNSTFYIVDKAGMNMHYISQCATDFQRRKGLDLIVIDYLQIIGREKGHSTNDEVGKISVQIKNLAKELGVPIIVGSQLSRANAIRSQSGGSNEPLLSDLRDSGSLEQDADVVLLLHRESYYDHNADPESAQINVAKHRNGMTGIVKMKYSSAFTKFIDPTEEF